MSEEPPIRGQIWLLALDPTVGSEMRKTRPVVVVSSDAFAHLDVRLVVPLTSWQARFDHHLNKVSIAATEANGLRVDSGADVLQLRAVSFSRVIRLLGMLEPEALRAICGGIAVAVEHDVRRSPN